MFGWVMGVFGMQEKDITEQCGLDAAASLRVLITGLKMSLVGCCNALWLLPSYRTAKTADETQNVVDFVDK